MHARPDVRLMLDVFHGRIDFRQVPILEADSNLTDRQRQACGAIALILRLGRSAHHYERPLGDDLELVTGFERTLSHMGFALPDRIAESCRYLGLSETRTKPNEKRSRIYLTPPAVAWQLSPEEQLRADAEVLCLNMRHSRRSLSLAEQSVKALFGE